MLTYVEGLCFNRESHRAIFLPGDELLGGVSCRCPMDNEGMKTRGSIATVSMVHTTKSRDMIGAVKLECIGILSNAW